MFSQEKVQVLSECFPGIEDSVLIDTLRECDSDTSDAAQMLLPPPPNSQPAPSRAIEEPCCSKDVVDQTP